jgi:hypothetical protein
MLLLNRYHCSDSCCANARCCWYSLDFRTGRRGRTLLIWGNVVLASNRRVDNGQAFSSPDWCSTFLASHLHPAQNHSCEQSSVPW